MQSQWNARSAQKLDHPDRLKKLPPQTILLQLGLQKGMSMADMGCGTGFFSLPAAKIVGRDAPVYAMDLSPEMLEIVSRRAAAEQIGNIQPVQVEAYDFKVENGAVRFGLISHVLHEIPQKERFLQEAFRILEPGGTLALLEWQPKNQQSGPSLAERIAPEEMEALLAKFGFTQTNSYPINNDAYAAAAIRP